MIGAVVGFSSKSEVKRDHHRDDLRVSLLKENFSLRPAFSVFHVIFLLLSSFLSSPPIRSFRVSCTNYPPGCVPQVRIGICWAQFTHFERREQKRFLNVKRPLLFHILPLLQICVYWEWIGHEERRGEIVREQLSWNIMILCRVGSWKVNSRISWLLPKEQLLLINKREIRGSIRMQQLLVIR